jgi:sporulation-control protein spo0M
MRERNRALAVVTPLGGDSCGVHYEIDRDRAALLTWAEQELDQDEAERQAGEERAILAWKRISRLARALGVL